MAETAINMIINKTEVYVINGEIIAIGVVVMMVIKLIIEKRQGNFCTIFKNSAW